MRWLWLILVLPCATALVLVLFGSRFSRGPASTVAGVLLLFFLAAPATLAVVVAGSSAQNLSSLEVHGCRRDEGITCSVCCG